MYENSLVPSCSVHHKNHLTQDFLEASWLPKEKVEAILNIIAGVGYKVGRSHCLACVSLVERPWDACCDVLGLKLSSMNPNAGRAGF